MITTLKDFVPKGTKSNARHGLRRLRRLFLSVREGPAFTCPCCEYQGRFLAYGRSEGRRLNAQCPQCGALERHRLQFCVLKEVLGGDMLRDKRVLHFAPEKIIAKYLRPRAGEYVGADLYPSEDQVRADMRDLQFEDASFDLIYASHVLEHVDDDASALAEVRRVLRPGGMAILPVPIVADKTVEYPEPSPSEHYHVRAPGRDYYDRYRKYFADVTMRSSFDYDASYQLHVYEDRTIYPRDVAPLRPPMSGDRHVDEVPICRA